MSGRARHGGGRHGRRRGCKPGRRKEKAERNERIRAQFDGDNWLELSEQYDLSIRMIRYVVSGK